MGGVGVVLPNVSSSVSDTLIVIILIIIIIIVIVKIIIIIIIVNIIVIIAIVIVFLYTIHNASYPVTDTPNNNLCITTNFVTFKIGLSCDSL